MARNLAVVARLLVDAAEAAARVRAALGYANMTVKDAPAHPRLKDAGITYATLTRIVSSKNPRGADIEELWAIADACNVPRPFMERGFEALAEVVLAQRLEELARDVATLQLRVEGLDGEAGSP